MSGRGLPFTPRLITYPEPGCARNRTGPSYSGRTYPYECQKEMPCLAQVFLIMSDLSHTQNKVVPGIGRVRPIPGTHTFTSVTGKCHVW